MGATHTGSDRLVGRPTKLTPALAETICANVRRGVVLEVAAAAAGVHRSTLWRWVERGERESKGLYATFRDAVEAARADAEVSAAGVVLDAARDGDWRAASWYLQHSVPDRWSGMSRELRPAEAGVSPPREPPPDSALRELVATMKREGTVPPQWLIAENDQHRF